MQAGQSALDTCTPDKAAGRGIKGMTDVLCSVEAQHLAMVTPGAGELAGPLV